MEQQSGGAKLKLKMSQIVDQGCGFKVEMLPGHTLQKMRAHVVAVEGDSPLVKEEFTSAQSPASFTRFRVGRKPSVTWPYGVPH